jgi:hypothetical protein
MLALLKRDSQNRDRVQSCNLICPLTPLTKRERSIWKSCHQEHLLTEVPLDQGGNLIPPERFMEMVYAVFDDTDAVEDYKMQKEAKDPIAFAASSGDPDTLPYKDAMGGIYSPNFKSSMVKEANDHTTRGTWEIWEKRNVPDGHKILSSVLAFKRK